ncbi:hypothetical protein O181_081000 [Austropuccinia psidii MF-1]|uniref:Uncharacterized protein n=1 Tax=Austropuccinia psidii MF-1 TaxID=1389203 RepID=A0A9Q3IJF8_9BASI|nr:hypothetical protein [Austropuccinia psidii MF-1]
MACLKGKGNFSENKKKELAEKKAKSPVEAPEDSKCKNMPYQVPDRGKKAPKSNKKGKAKYKWNKPQPQNYRTPNKETKAMDNVFNMARTLMEFKNKEEERINQYFTKK